MAPEIPHDQPSIESPLSGDRLDFLTSKVATSIEDDQRTRHLTTSYLPSRREVIGVLERLSWLLFPGFNGPREIDPGELKAHTRSLLSEIAGPLFIKLLGHFDMQKQLSLLRLANIVPIATNVHAKS